MCELFAYSGFKSTVLNPYLKEFASHSEKHPHGWGMAIFYRDAVNLEKEPVTANSSIYLRERLRHSFEVKNMMAHIRLATLGNLAYENTHPFVGKDASGHVWTLIHNGMIFSSTILDEYCKVQEGKTDSERILCHILARMNRLQDKLGRAPDSIERFKEVDEIIQEITPYNKVNLIIYDGEQFYIHTNMRETLFMKQHEEGVLFATVPLDSDIWTPVPFMQLLAFRDGKHILSGTPHSNEYVRDASGSILSVDSYAYL